MALSIYFAKPCDTPIASENPAFINALQCTAKQFKDFYVSQNPKTADVVIIDERYQYRTWRYADELTQCNFIRRNADRICVINHDSYARTFLPGLYTSLEMSKPSMVPAVPIPYKWDLWHVPIPNAFDFRPKQLFTFCGTFHSHPIRKRMHKILSQSSKGSYVELRKAFHSHDKNDQLSYIKDIRNARFSLCPRGISPSSYRLYESMQLGRCPVIISDDWIAPPGPDWKKFSIIIAESKIKHLAEILTSKIDFAETYGQLAYQAWQDFFSWPRRRKYFLEQVKVLLDNKSTVCSFSNLYELWSGRDFRHCYQWTLSGRAKQLIIRKFRALSEPAVPTSSL